MFPFNRAELKAPSQRKWPLCFLECILLELLKESPEKKKHMEKSFVLIFVCDFSLQLCEFSSDLWDIQYVNFWYFFVIFCRSSD